MKGVIMTTQEKRIEYRVFLGTLPIKVAIKTVVKRIFLKVFGAIGEI